MTPLTLGLMDGAGLSTVVGSTDGDTQGSASVGTHGVSVSVGDTLGVVQGSASVGTHGVDVVQGSASVGTHGVGVAHGSPSDGTHGGHGFDEEPGSQGPVLGSTVGATVGAGVRPVCAGFVLAMPLLPSHS